MVAAVAILVVILALLVSGYQLNSELSVERQGMLQVYSMPTGATVTVDDETYSWLDRTNTSKVISAGEHTVTLTRNGYDSWSKTITVKEGLLYRIHYPRLFLDERTQEEILDASDTTNASISPNLNLMLLTNDTTSWELLTLDAETVTSKTVDISSAFSAVTMPETSSIDGSGTSEEDTVGTFNGTIKSINWAKDNEHVLFEVESDSGREWVLLNIKNPTTDRINLTREFAADFSEVEILNDSASALLVVLDGNLRRIDVSSRQLSAILVENVESFDHFDSAVVFSAKETSEIEKELAESRNDSTDDYDNEQSFEYYVGVLNLSNNTITPERGSSSAAKTVILEFYDEKYLATLEETKVTLYKYSDFSEVLSSELSFAPENIKTGHDGEFITMWTGAQIATLDLEGMLTREWNASSDDFNWIDDDMIYSISDGTLTVYDFDGLNERTLASSVSAEFPVVISSNRYLYYFSDGSLMREIIRN